MSRNKIVRFVHDFTGLSFKDSRTLCKAAKWNEEMIISAVIAQYIEKYCSFVESFKPVIDTIADVVNEIIKQTAEIADCIAAALLNSENPPAFAPYSAPTDSNDKLPATTQDDAETQQGGK